MKMVYHIISALIGLIFTNAGLDKFLHHMNPPVEEMPAAVVAQMQALTQIPWMMPLVGVVEILGGILLIFPKTRLLGTIVLVPIMVGIIIINLNMMIPKGLIIVTLITIVMIWIMMKNKEKLANLIN